MVRSADFAGMFGGDADAPIAVVGSEKWLGESEQER
jgi:hypothetical protein